MLLDFITKNLNKNVFVISSYSSVLNSKKIHRGKSAPLHPRTACVTDPWGQAFGKARLMLQEDENVVHSITTTY